MIGLYVLRWNRHPWFYIKWQQQAVRTRCKHFVWYSFICVYTHIWPWLWVCRIENSIRGQKSLGRGREDFIHLNFLVVITEKIREWVRRIPRTLTHLIVAYDFVGPGISGRTWLHNSTLQSISEILQWYSARHWARLDGPRWFHTCLPQKIIMVYIHWMLAR